MPALAPGTSAHLFRHSFGIGRFSQAESVLPNLRTESLMRLLRCFIWSIRRRAQTNSAASKVSPRKITSQPGPGVKNITTPTTRSVKPARILKKRRTCSIERKTIDPQEAEERGHLIVTAFAVRRQQPRKQALLICQLFGISGVELNCRAMRIYEAEWPYSPFSGQGELWAHSVRICGMR